MDSMFKFQLDILKREHENIVNEFHKFVIFTADEYRAAYSLIKSHVAEPVDEMLLIPMDLPAEMPAEMPAVMPAELPVAEVNNLDDIPRIPTDDVTPACATPAAACATPACATLACATVAELLTDITRKLNSIAGQSAVDPATGAILAEVCRVIQCLDKLDTKNVLTPR